MAFFMSGVLVAINTGIDDGFFIRWAYSFIIAFPIAYPIAFFVGPLVHKVVSKIFPDG